MSSREQATRIVIATTDGKIVSIDYDEKIRAKGDPIKDYLDYAISQANYELKFVTCFVDRSGESRMQYTLVNRDFT